MKLFDNTLAVEGPDGESGESPFAEAFASRPATVNGFARWSEALSPFVDPESEQFVGETDAMLAEALAELRDEAFHEATALLAEETEQAVADHFTSESALYGPQVERFADHYLSGVRFEAEQYLGTLEKGLVGLNVEALGPEELASALDQFDPQPGQLSPAGEEFIGKLVKKAKKAVSFVASKAKAVGKLALPLLAPMLGQLRKLVQPLLKRVLSMAIGRLPAPLQPAARQVSAKLIGKQEAESEGDEPQMAPATQFDVEALADSFDDRLAEAVAYPETYSGIDHEAFSNGEPEAFAESNELEWLTEARGELIDQLGEGEAERIEPAIEQFLPVALGALRTGIKLVGRPRVVGVLAKYLAKLVGPWVNKDVAAPLSRAIADTGLKLATLEAESEGYEESEAVPIALASVIEDSVRRFAENENYIFENQDLTQVALAEAFGEAVATHFPQDQVREALQLAPSLGGTFVTRRARRRGSYAKYSRTPDVEISSRVADTLPSFGGASLGETMRAAGGKFPMRARMHIYQMRPGSTAGSALRHDRRPGGARSAFPLTPNAAAVLLREPGLGKAVPRRFLKSGRKLAAGQRIFILEPLGAGQGSSPGSNPRLAPGRIWLSLNPAKARIGIGFRLSEADAQEIASALSAGRGPAPLLSKLFTGLRRATAQDPAVKSEDFDPPAGEEGEGFDSFAAARGIAGAAIGQLRKQVAAWALPALADWLPRNADAFSRAAAHPDPGVTLRMTLNGVAGLATSALPGSPGALSALRQALRGKPVVTIMVSPGRQK